MFAYGLSACATLAGAHRHGAASPIQAAGAAADHGGRHDAATRRRRSCWAEALADQLDSGVLVTRDGDGHTGYSAGNACVDNAVESYLVAGTVPKAEVDC